MSGGFAGGSRIGSLYTGISNLGCMGMFNFGLAIGVIALGRPPKAITRYYGNGLGVLVMME